MPKKREREYSHMIYWWN